MKFGGETWLPELGIELTHVMGRAVIWNSLLPNSDVNQGKADSAKAL